jgi:hypothetical protein
MTMTLIETKTLGTAQASIEFISLPQDGTDLVALCSVRSAGANFGLFIRPNGSTTNLSSRNLQGNGSSASSFTGSVEGLITSSGDTANTFANTSFYLTNYTANTAKSISIDAVSENNATTAYQRIAAGLWNDTTAITSLQFWPDTSGSFAAGSTISIYKITKGTLAGVVVS